MSLLDTMRDTALVAFWNQGVKLARAGNVHIDEESDEEIVLKVRVARVAVPFTVHLWPVDSDWSCDCEANQEVCAHAAAGVIAWVARQAEPAPTPERAPPRRMEPGRAPCKVGYRLTTSPDGFRVERVLVRLNQDEPFVGTLLGQARSGAGAILSTDADIELEEAMGRRFGITVERERVPRVLAALELCPDRTLDGKPIAVSGEPVLPIARIEDDPNPANKDGFRVRIVRDPGIETVFRNSAVLCEGVLRPVGTGGLSPNQRKVFYQRDGVSFQPDEVEKLVAEVLPALKARLPVELRTTRLPDGREEPPRLVLETREQGDALIVRPIIVYGDPITARVDRGELKVTGGRVPVRDRRAEDRLRQAAHEKIGLPLDLDRTFHGAGAVRFVDRIGDFGGDVIGEAWKRFRRARDIQPSVQIDGDRLNVDFGGADPTRVVEAWLEGAELVRVSDGWAPLPTGWLEEHGHLVADLLAARDAGGGWPPRPLRPRPPRPGARPAAAPGPGRPEGAGRGL